MCNNAIDLTISQLETKIQELIVARRNLKSTLAQVEKEKNELFDELATIRADYNENQSELTAENELLKYRYQQLIHRIESLEKNF